MIDGLVALIPMRSGSKSIPKKNIRPIAGKPLCFYALDAALQSKLFEKIVVSTDSEEIADTVKKINPAIEILWRPASLAADSTSTEAVMLHVAKNIDFDTLATIQVTSPLMTAADFINAYKKFKKEKLDSLLTAVRVKRFFWDSKNQPLNYNPQKRPRRQEFAGSMMENGAFYFTQREVLVKKKCRLGGKIGIHEMAAETALEIDEQQDWVEIEKMLLRRRGSDLKNVLKKIKLLVLDVDGTLTDAGMYYTKDGDYQKKFNTKDGMGIQLIRQAGVKVALMTTENSEIVTARAKKLKIELCYINIQNKLEQLKTIIGEQNLTLEGVAYVGDDINDLECLRSCGFTASPNDAVEKVRAAVMYVSQFKGGEGAVRDVCELILKARNE